MITEKDIAIAIEWLEANEGAGGEATSCHTVARWLRSQMQRRATDNALKQVSRATGQPMHVVRNSPGVRRALGMKEKDNA